jgi:Bacterial extracellular solute-binding proteins, family 3
MKAQTLAMLAVVIGAHGAQARDMRFVTEPFPPYTYATDGRAAGPMVDVLQTACARLAWRCDIEVLPWRRALGMAQRAEVEGIFTVVDSPERRQYFHVSPAVIEGRYVLYARAGNGLQYSGDPQVLAGRTLGAYGPSATALTLESLVEGVARVRTEIEPDNRTVMRKLAAGRYGPTADPRRRPAQPAACGAGEGVRLLVRPVAPERRPRPGPGLRPHPVRPLPHRPHGRSPQTLRPAAVALRQVTAGCSSRRVPASASISAGAPTGTVILRLMWPMAAPR